MTPITSIQELLDRYHLDSCIDAATLWLDGGMSPEDRVTYEEVFLCQSTLNCAMIRKSTNALDRAAKALDGAVEHLKAISAILMEGHDDPKAPS